MRREGRNLHRTGVEKNILILYYDNARVAAVVGRSIDGPELRANSARAEVHASCSNTFTKRNDGRAERFGAVKYVWGVGLLLYLGITMLQTLWR